MKAEQLLTNQYQWVREMIAIMMRRNDLQIKNNPDQNNRHLIIMYKGKCFKIEPILKECNLKHINANFIYFEVEHFEYQLQEKDYEIRRRIKAAKFRLNKNPLEKCINWILNAA